MAFVPVPKDLNRVKTKVMFNLLELTTKRSDLITNKATVDLELTFALTKT